MIKINDPSNIVFKLEPYNFQNENVYPELNILNIEQLDEYYRIKVEGKNLRAKVSYQVDTSKYFNSYEIVYDVYAYITSPMNATFYMNVPKKYFSYLAKDVELPYKDFQIELIDYDVDSVFETDDYNVSNNNYLVSEVKNNFIQTFDNKIYYSINL